MTDIDRLRAAADECDYLADQASKQPPGYSWMVSHYRKTAALLRAVAREAVCHCGPEWTERGLHSHDCPRYAVMSDAAEFALALADTILDTDRLRAAAREADRTAVYLHGTMTPTMHATAALLRAVAEDVKVWNGYMPDQPTNAKIHKRAFALADVILGERDD